MIYEDIKKFNDMYKLVTPEKPEVINGRLENFHKILVEELKEVDDIYPATSDLEMLVNLADWLGDIIIYCLSEMLRWGLDPETVLRIIMQSNFSKLGEDGEPIYDDRGKVMKGPGYWKPEPALKDYIASRLNPEGEQV